MSDYLEWVGGDGFDDGGEDGQEEREAYYQQRQELDVVLCLVDCRESMFEPFVSTNTTNSNPNNTTLPSSTSAAVDKTQVKKEGVKIEQQSSPQGQNSNTNTTSSSSHDNNNSEDKRNTSSSASPFQLSMEFILKFYQNKILTSDRDMVALALYDTEQSNNIYDFTGVYLLRPFQTLGADTVQEVERLLAAGDRSSSGYATLRRQLGHRPSCRPTTLSDALWAAQHMFINLKSSAIKYRRIFVFTNQDNPVKDDPVGAERCRSRARDLAESGAFIEVFGFGRTSSNLHSSSSDFIPPEARDEHTTLTTTSNANNNNNMDSIFASATAGASTRTHTVHGTSSSSASPSSPPTTTTHSGDTSFFDVEAFWNPLISNKKNPSSNSNQRQHSHSNDNYSAASNLDKDNDSDEEYLYRGNVYVSNPPPANYHHNNNINSFEEAGLHPQGAFNDLLQMVKQKVHPQRPFVHCNLTIGMRADGGLLPTVAVSVYTPLMRAVKPRSCLLEASSNRPIKMQRQYKKVQNNNNDDSDENNETDANKDGVEGSKKRKKTPSHAREDDNNYNEDNDAFAVRPEELQYTVTVGGKALFLTSEEKAKIIETATADTPPGITILCFKKESDVIRHEHVLLKSSFVHLNYLRNGSRSSVKLFVQLVRTLYKQHKVALAVYRMRQTSQPRLVALVPSLSPSEETTRPNNNNNTMKYTRPIVPETSKPAEGLGFYLLPLPYAEDLREVPPLSRTTLAVKGNDPVLFPASSSSLSENEQAKLKEQLSLSSEIVKKLSVSYNICAVPNPSLQLQYTSLQSLALRHSLANTNNNTGVHHELSFFASSLQDDEDGEMNDNNNNNNHMNHPPHSNFTDFTRPDEEGMRRYADLFHQFNTSVLEPEYTADSLCPQPKSAVGNFNNTLVKREDNATAAHNNNKTRGSSSTSTATKKVKLEDHTSDETASEIENIVLGFHQRNALQQLTVAQLKEFMRVCGVAAKGHTRKDQLIQLVSEYLVKKHGA